MGFVRVFLTCDGGEQRLFDLPKDCIIGGARSGCRDCFFACKRSCYSVCVGAKVW
jgi:hypothetical protein